MMSSRWKAVLLLFIPIIILSGYLIRNDSKQKAHEISNECVKNRVECINTKILSYISKSPEDTGKIFDSFWGLEKKGEFSDDPRIFSDMVHEAGMILGGSNIPLAKALTYCGTSFKQGCIHGVIMEYIDNKYDSIKNPQELFDLCSEITSNQQSSIYINCLHGVGHEFAAKEKISLQEVLNLCSSLSDEERFSCASGVFMEYSKGTAGSGFHSHMPVGKKELPCSEISDEYKSVCYASAGSYRQYAPAQEDFSKSYNFCLNVPEKYRNDCLTGLSERTILATAENQQKLKIICDSMENNDAKIACVNSTSKLLE